MRINETSELDNCCAELNILLRAVTTRMNQFMSVPIYNTQNAVVGVLQLFNKVCFINVPSSFFLSFFLGINVRVAVVLAVAVQRWRCTTATALISHQRHLLSSHVNWVTPATHK